MFMINKNKKLNICNYVVWWLRNLPEPRCHTTFLFRNSCTIKVVILLNLHARTGR